MTKRIFNFSAGPGMLADEVLEEAQRDLLALPGVGMSVLEISHRSKTFDAIIEGCEADMRSLANIPQNYRVLFLQGGASLQFAMVPMNLMPAGGKADYVVTGIWAEKAYEEAQKFGKARLAASTKADNHNRIPDASEIQVDPEAAYLHYTTNNTIVGTEWSREPETGNVPLVADASSDIFSRPIDVTKYALIYAGAQKNLGPAGATLVIVRDDMVARSPKTLPTMLDYSVHAKDRSIYNTPPVFTIYIMGLVMKWLIRQGGLEAIGRRNAEKAAAVYDTIDGSGGFYRAHAKPGSRSNMNLTFRLPSEELEKKFGADAGAEGFDGLKGHRSIGGMRASIYNAFPRAGVDAFVSFMKEFQKKNG